MLRSPIIAAVLCACALCAQDTTIRTTVPLVVLSTAVTDKHGHPINGLTSSDFVLLDNTTPKPVNSEVIEAGLSPVALAVLVQSSDISLSALAKIRKVGPVVSQAVVGGNGEAAVITFSDEIRVLQDFTQNADALDAAFSRLTPGENMSGRMLDALDESLTMLAKRPGPRRNYVLIIGESRDRGSKIHLSDLQPKLERSGATVYFLKYSAYLTPFTIKPEEYEPTGGGLLTGVTEVARLAKKNTMEALVNMTGGESFSFETKGKLETDLLRVSADLHNRYQLSFVPDASGQPSFHQIAVTVRDHPEAIVRTRPGYWTK